jgi:hypothetical protein
VENLLHFAVLVRAKMLVMLATYVFCRMEKNAHVIIIAATIYLAIGKKNRYV